MSLVIRSTGGEVSASVPAVFRHLQLLWAPAGADPPPAADPAPLAATMPVLDTLATSGYQAYALIDMCTQQYLYLSPNIGQLTGFPVAEVAAGGLAWLFQRLLPDDLAPLMVINQTKWAFYQALPDAERATFRANFDFRVCHADARYRRVQQQSICLRATPEGLPHVILAQLVDITHLKPALPADTDKPALLLTLHTGGPDRVVLQCAATHTTRLDRPLLSPREQQVLTFLSHGLSSRAIAQKLGTQPATVDTQRRQMLQKTGVVDTTALVTYGRLLGWV